MILGYIISSDFNDSYMFDDEDKEMQVCNKCGYVTDFEYISKRFKLTKTIYDISHTYDSHTIVSNRFKEFCRRNGYQGLVFKELPNDRYFYSFFVRNILPFDTNRVKLERTGYCEACENYKSVTPAIPLAIKGLNAPLGDGIFCTDIRFASGNEKHPITMIGIETYIKMKREKFRGIGFIKFDTELSVPWK